MRMEPPVSVPSAPRHSPAATAAPEPQLDPPVTHSVSQGLRAGPKCESTAGRPERELVQVELADDTAPASRSRSAAPESAVATLSRGCSRRRSCGRRRRRRCPSARPGRRAAGRGTRRARSRRRLCVRPRGPVGGHGDEGVQPRLHRFDAGEAGVRQLDRRQLLALDERAASAMVSQWRSVIAGRPEAGGGLGQAVVVGGRAPVAGLRADEAERQRGQAGRRDGDTGLGERVSASLWFCSLAILPNLRHLGHNLATEARLEKRGGEEGKSISTLRIMLDTPPAERYLSRNRDSVCWPRTDASDK